MQGEAGGVRSRARRVRRVARARNGYVCALPGRVDTVGVGGSKPLALRAFNGITKKVAYGSINRVDWRTVAAKDVAVDDRELREQLLPLRGEALDAWSRSAARLVSDCRKRLKVVLPLRKQETEFLDQLLDEGEVAPGLLTDDVDMVARLLDHPGLKWKALNVKKHKGKR